MKIRDIIETTSGAVATVAMPMGKPKKRKTNEADGQAIDYTIRYSKAGMKGEYLYITYNIVSPSNAGPMEWAYAKKKITSTPEHKKAKSEGWYMDAPANNRMMKNRPGERREAWIYPDSVHEEITPMSQAAASVIHKGKEYWNQNKRVKHKKSGKDVNHYINADDASEVYVDDDGKVYEAGPANRSSDK